MFLSIQDIKGKVYLVDGGFLYHGEPIRNISVEQILDVIQDLKKNSLENVVISGIYSHKYKNQEEMVK